MWVLTLILIFKSYVEINSSSVTDLRANSFEINLVKYNLNTNLTKVLKNIQNIQSQEPTI